MKLKPLMKINASALVAVLIATAVTQIRGEEECYTTLGQSEVVTDFTAEVLSFDVYSNEDWVWTCNADWIEIPMPRPIFGSRIFSFNVAENPTDATREATITITGLFSGMVPLDFKVTQLGHRADTDGDGCPDDEDPYPNSILVEEFPVILIGNVEIENAQVDDCSTLADLIDDVLGRDLDNADLVVYLQGWRDAGYLTGREMGQIIKENN